MKSMEEEVKKENLDLDHIKKETEENMKNSRVVLKDELKKVRTGRAQISMLDSIRVNYYGNLTPLNQVASLSCPDAKSFLIAPWEIKILKEIETSIVKSNIGMTPQNDGKVIRLKLPELTEEHRKELVKKIKKIVEEVRIHVRQFRRETNNRLKEALRQKKMSEDSNKKIIQEIQTLTDRYIDEINKIGESKEKDLMTI